MLGPFLRFILESDIQFQLKFSFIFKLHFTVHFTFQDRNQGVQTAQGELHYLPLERSRPLKRFLKCFLCFLRLRPSQWKHFSEKRIKVKLADKRTEEKIREFFLTSKLIVTYLRLHWLAYYFNTNTNSQTYFTRLTLRSKEQPLI